ncbi:5670_t:CDS:2 [Funneliformis mosseae]|uniref:5670_t:CDS:1 n=1 Tax=Funneliformis mosseae TaxID=27381 RepID=A0A9N9H2E1_FUNMO|nr:5670_t:CDS:2 [Funneliformis mosseae]
MQTENASDSAPTIYNMVSFYDNTIVVHIIRQDKSVPVEDGILWVDKYLSIRMIYPGGNVVPIDIKLDIQDFNFRLLDVNGRLVSAIEIFPVRSNFLLVTYTEASDLDDPYTYNDWALIVDLNGKIYSNISFGSAYINVATNEWLPGRAEIFINFNPDKGFLRLAPGEDNLLANGILRFSDSSSHLITAIPMVDGRYAIIYANSTIDSTLWYPFDLRGTIFAIFLEYGSNTELKPFILYQTSIPNTRFTYIDCDVSYVEFGQICVVTSEYTHQEIINKSYLNIKFLSSGAVVNFVIPSMIDFQTSLCSIDQYYIQSLPYGGYLLSGTQKIGDRVAIVGYIFKDFNEIFAWNLANPTMSNFLGISTILKNNTYVLAQPGGKQNWSLITTELFQFEKIKEHGYDNLLIDDTFPNRNVTIRSDIESLEIKYYDQVEISNGNITIFQDGGNLRQIVSGNDASYVTLKDGNNIFVKIIQSTFNKPGRYYVLIGYGFVKNKALQEPLYGVKEHVWSFTVDSETKTSSGSVMGQVRLSPEGTTYFGRLNNIERKDFHEKLRQDLANAIPVDINRVTSNEKTEVDTSQYVLSINILHDENKQEIPTSLAIKDLDILIKNKFITAIAYGEASKYLDESYGYKPNSNLWKTYGHPFIIVLVFVFLLILLYLLAKRLSSEQENEIEEFSEWSKNNLLIISLFTLLAGADVEVISLLESKIAGYSFFNAKFSEAALSKIFWGNCINLFIEDIPQVIIQIIYYREVIFYTFIPMFALLLSVVTLTINIIKIIGRLYVLFKLFKSKDHKYEEIIGNSNSDYSNIIDKDDDNLGGSIDECVF